jgi:hypothetical protein
MLSVIILGVFMPSVIILIVVMLSVIVLSVMAPFHPALCTILCDQLKRDLSENEYYFSGATTFNMTTLNMMTLSISIKM